jgi:hypothetical protein
VSATHRIRKSNERSAIQTGRLLSARIVHWPARPSELNNSDGTSELPGQLLCKKNGVIE